VKIITITLTFKLNDMNNKELNIIAFITVVFLILFMNGCTREKHLVKSYSTDGNVESIVIRERFLDRPLSYARVGDTLTYYKNGDTLRYSIVLKIRQIDYFKLN